MPPLSSLSWTATEHLRASVLVVPIGATEQHGPHLPLTTDSDIAQALVDGLCNLDVVIAPVVAFGSSGEHQSFAGTLSVGQDALEGYLVELGRSATCTWDRIVFVCTHGGNRDAVARASRRLRGEGCDARVWAPRWGGDAHAGRTETSLMLAIDPERVDVGASATGITEPLEQLMPLLARHGVASVSTNGVLGDPSGASATEGKQLLAAASASLSELIAHWPPAEAPDVEA